MALSDALPTGCLKQTRQATPGLAVNVPATGPANDGNRNLSINDAGTPLWEFVKPVASNFVLAAGGNHHSLVECVGWKATEASALAIACRALPLWLPHDTDLRPIRTNLRFSRIQASPNPRHRRLNARGSSSRNVGQDRSSHTNTHTHTVTQTMSDVEDSDVESGSESGSEELSDEEKDGSIVVDKEPTAAGKGSLVFDAGARMEMLLNRLRSQHLDALTSAAYGKTRAVIQR